MLENFSFYLTNVIDNTNRLDKCANQCLSTLRGVMHLWNGSRSVGVFHINLEKQRVHDMTPSDLTLNAKTITQIVLNIFMMIFMPMEGITLGLLTPLAITLIGLGLKAIALKDQNLQDKYQFLRDTKQTWNSLRQCSVLPIPDHLILKNILSWLSSQDIKTLTKVNQAWRDLLSSPQSEFVQNYHQQCLSNVSLTSVNYSFLSLVNTCQETVNQFHYNQQIADLFGGIDHLLRLPLISIKANANDADIENLTQEDDFKNYPPIFRLRFESQGKEKESIFIKYTFFVPKEETQHSVDSTWQDYLLLSYEQTSAQWICYDPRFSDSIKDQRRSTNNQRWLLHPGRYPKVISEKLDEKGLKRLKKMLNHESIEVFEGQLQPRPVYLKGGVRYEHDREKRMFKDIPCVLGHVSLSHFNQRLKTVQMGADFLVDPNGYTICNLDRQPYDNPQMLVFE